MAAEIIVANSGMAKPKQDGSRDFSVQATGAPGQAVTFALAGRIALANLPALKGEITTLLDRYSPASLTMDLAEVTFLDRRAPSLSS
jgi:hypothetical protein